jgi:TonB-dependent SusC/RagA subfamily outer membrane receptor
LKNKKYYYYYDTTCLSIVFTIENNCICKRLRNECIIRFHFLSLYLYKFFLQKNYCVMRKFSLTLCFLFTLLLSYSLYAQTRTVTGKVIDSEKKPISGASILIKGKSQGTAADADGNFTLKVPDGRVQLEITSVGYLKREVNLRPDENNITIEMRSDSSQLKDVVVTALGITRQAKTLVYATQNVKVSELTGVRASDNVLNSLQGKMANAVINQGSGCPGSGAIIVLRGNRSIQGDNNALIVVDGVPIENNTYSAAGGTFGSIQGSEGASNINPDDIESVTVLRGASDAALYGSQARNGVIVITTKKGSKDKISVNVNSGAVFANACALPKVRNIYGQGNNNQYVDSLFGDSWGAKMTGQTYTNFLGQTQNYAPQSNNSKDFFQTGLGLNNSISASGGNSKAQTYLSYTNNSIQGIIPKNILLRHTITLRLTNQISSKFSTDAKTTYISNQDIKNKP